MRCFLAVSPPAENDLDEAAAMLRSCQKGLRPVRAEARHLTIAFLGELDRESIPILEENLTVALEGFEAFPWRIRGLGAFPDIPFARVLWCGVEDHDPWRELRSRVDVALSSSGLAAIGSDFHPHITLARLRRGRPSGPLRSLLRGEAGRDFGAGVCRELHLISSILRPDGPRYETLKTFEFPDLV